jgi:methylated-DNA-[protein]-cysteine S-methyltransferase
MIEDLLRGGPPGGLSGPPDVSEAAARAGLLDVAYTFEDSPLGRLLLATTPRGLVRVAYDDVLDELAAKLSPRVLAAPKLLDEPRRQLEQFFAGRRQSFELALDWSLTHGFGRRVLQATSRIPFGEVSSYKQVAIAAGSPRAFRAAGTALGHNPLPIVVPCHRVLREGGQLGQYTGGVWRKQTLLSVEGRAGS